MDRRGRRAGVIAASLVMLSAGSVPANEWEGLRVGGSKAEEAKQVLGRPAAEYPDSLVFKEVALPSKLNPDTVVVNLRADQVIESIFVFPIWGTTEQDVRKVLGSGQVMRYGDFLRTTGRTAIGAGTRADQKLHYLQLDDRVEVYAERGILVTYENRELASGNDLVKLIIFY